MITGKIISGENNLSEVYQIWDRVFDSKYQVKIKTIDEEADTVYVLVYEGKNQPESVATGRIILKMDGEAIIDGLAVIKDHQRKYYGDFAIRMLLNRALIKDYKRITLETPIDQMGFFEKIGFVAIDKQHDHDETSKISMIYPYNEIKKRCNSTYLG